VPARLLSLVLCLFVCGCVRKGQTYDAEALRKAVESVERKQTEHPARFGDPTGELSSRLARDALVGACPTLPVDIRTRLDVMVELTSGQRTRPTRMSKTLTEAFRARRDASCKDPAVFDELGSLPPQERGPTMLARCGLDATYRAGEPLGEALSRIGLLAPVLRRHLIENQIDPDLATRTVAMFGYPIAQEQSKAALAHMRDSGPAAPDGGLLVRASAEGITLVDGPTVRFDGLDAPVLGKWIAAQAPSGTTEWDVDLVLDFAGDVPAEAIVAVVSAVDPSTSSEVFLLVEQDGQTIGAETIAPASGKADYRLTASGGRASVRPANVGPDAATELDGDLEALATWAEKAPASTSVQIDPTGLDVQGLVDIVAALRGPDCRTLAALQGEAVPPECHVVRYELGSASPPS